LLVIKIVDMAQDVYFAFRKAQVKGIETERLGVIHVSDLTKPCMRYALYNKICKPDSMDTENLRPLYLGQSIHNNSFMAKPEHHEMFLAYDYITDEPLTYEKCISLGDKDPRWLDIILGSIDDLLKLDDIYYICDKKTTGSIKFFENHWRRGTIANEEHRLQTSIYGVLLKKCYDIDVNWGCNVYFPTRVPEGEREKVIPLAYKLLDKEKTSAIMIDNALTLKESLTEKTIPERTLCFLCNGMCPHATFCFQDERKNYEKV